MSEDNTEISIAPEPKFNIPQKTNTIKTSPQFENKESVRPFKPSDIEAIPVSVGKAEPGDKTTMAKVSEEHGRATVDTRISHNAIWGDEYKGIVYGGTDTKGNVMPSEGSIILEHDPNSPIEELRAHGLKDKVGIDLIEKASRKLRRSGLPTENPVKVVKVEEIIENGQKIPYGEWKKREIDKRQAILNGPFTRRGDKEKAQRELNYLNKTDFYIMERDLQVPERLLDITKPKTEKELKNMMRPIVKWVNNVFDTKKEGIIPNTTAPEKFDFDKPDDIRRYFTDWLPTQMGIYLARLHKLNLVHNFAHAQNWSAVGTLYDLDSIQPPSFDNPEKDYAADTNNTIGALQESLGSEHVGNVATFLSRMAMPHSAMGAFAITYSLERGLISPNEPNPSQKVINEMSNYFGLELFGKDSARFFNITPERVAKIAKELKIAVPEVA